MSKSKQNDHLVEVVCENKVKRKMRPLVDGLDLTDLTSITGRVDYGPANGGVWDGYADRDEHGVWQFTRVGMVHEPPPNDNGSTEQAKAS